MSLRHARAPRRAVAGAFSVSLIALTLAACSSSSTADTAASDAAASPASSAAAPAASAPAASAAASEAASAPAAAAGAADLSGDVYYLMPNSTTTRFIEHDGPALVAGLKELAPNINVQLLDAENDPQKQLAQAETAIANGAKAIVLTSADPNLASGILESAAAASVPVVAYEHEAKGGPVAYQVIFDPYKVGVAQGTYAVDFINKLPGEGITVARLKGNKGDNYTIEDSRGQDETLKPLIDSGKIKVVCEDNVPNWDPANAQSLMEQCLTQNPDVQAVIAMNDGTASGAIAALAAAGLDGKVPVMGGQDANLDALQYILNGKQTSTVLKPYAVEGQTAAELVVAALTGEKPAAINSEFDNGFAKIPAAYLDVTSIDATNMQEVVDAGLYTKEDICAKVTVKNSFCG